MKQLIQYKYMNTVISLNNISKAYQLGVFNTGSFSTDLARWWALKRGKEDPFLKIGEENDTEWQDLIEDNKDTQATIIEKKDELDHRRNLFIKKLRV